MMTRRKALERLRHKPYLLGHAVGFTKLTLLHNFWIIRILTARTDITLQAHRGSYKTTCVSLAIALLILLFPDKKILFMRKTDDDVKEVIRTVKNILTHRLFQPFAIAIWGVPIELVTATATEVTTNLACGVKGTSQLVGLGLGGSITGKHFDIIFTDDIVNVKDRKSRTDREATKLAYQELQNIRNRGGRIVNTGTPWHKEDCFTLMPPAEKYDCYSTGLMTEEEISSIRSQMSPSLFAANYELKHISDEEIIFSTPQTGFDPILAEQGTAHIDAAYGGGDYTAFTIVKKQKEADGDTYYVYGRCWEKHIDECEDEIQRCMQAMKTGRLYCEDNGDKGYLAKDLQKRGLLVSTYHETMNKYIKIVTYLKGQWQNVRFVKGTDPEYIDQICDYNENAEHDDCPDSLASLMREMTGKKKVGVGNKAAIGLR